MLPTAAAVEAALTLAFIFVIGGGGGWKRWRTQRLRQSCASMARSLEVVMAAMIWIGCMTQRWRVVSTGSMQRSHGQALGGGRSVTSHRGMHSRG